MEKIQINNSIVSDRLKGKKKFAILLDPDKIEPHTIDHLRKQELDKKVDYLFIGGSLLTKNEIDPCISLLRKSFSTPIILFPGNNMQISAEADAILFLSLVSGRNPDLLIGQHVNAAPFLKKSGIEILPTAYLLIDGGKPTTASYISNTLPIPYDKAEIAASTALAAKMLGMQFIYLDCGSGSRKMVPPEMISTVKKEVDLPIIVGGGIRTAEDAENACKAGADVIVIGNAIEKDPTLLDEFSFAIHASEKVI